MYAVVDNEVVVALIPENASFVLNSHQYPANWLQKVSAGRRESLGIFPVVKDKRPTARYSMVTENAPLWDATEKVVRIAYSVGAINMDHVKTTEAARMAAHSKDLISITDQMVLDAHDHGKPVPAAWAAYRKAVKAEMTRLHIGINNATDEKSIVDVLLTAKWSNKPE